MSHLQIIVKAADITISKQINNIPPNQLETTATGLFLADDSTDPTASTLSAQADLVDGDLQTVISGSLTGSYSIGLDLGSSKTIQKLSIYDIIDGNYSGVNLFSTNDTFTVYSSDLNDGSADSWSLVQVFRPLDRVVFLDTNFNPSPIPSPLPSPLPFDTITDSVYKIDLVFETKPTARYFKAYASKGSVEDVGESTIQISEIQASIQEALSLATDKKNNILTVPSIVISNPIAVDGDGTGGSDTPLL